MANQIPQPLRNPSSVGLLHDVTSGTPVIDTNIFASGDCLGTLLTLDTVARNNGFPITIDSIVISDLTTQKSALDVVFFHTNPASTTFTCNAALDIADADLLSIAAVVSIEVADYATFADNSVVCKSDLKIPILLSAANKTLYAVLVCRGTPTYASVADLKLVVTYSVE